METDPERTRQGSIEGLLMRGGTSKGFFLREEDLPPPGKLRDEMLLEVFGSPDPLQVDGIGGSRSHTSKMMMIRPPENDAYDVEYTFGQIGVNEPDVDWSKNCGNLTSAIGVFALLEGVAAADGDTAELTLYNTNTDTEIDQTIPMDAGEPAVYGDYSVDGVPGTGAKIETMFKDPGGGATGALFPTGSPMDTIDTGSEELDVSVVDATNVVVFLRAEDLGLDGVELPAELEARQDILDLFARVRETIRELIGLENAKKSNPSIGVVSEPQSYDCSVDKYVEADEIDITSRWMSLQPHHAVGMTGAMCLGAAAQLPGTIPYEKARHREDELITLGHPKGTVTVAANVDTSGDEPVVRSITQGRTARPILRGKAYYRYVGALEALDDK
jgi:hypothetical protein